MGIIPSPSHIDLRAIVAEGSGALTLSNLQGSTTVGDVLGLDYNAVAGIKADLELKKDGAVIDVRKYFQSNAVSDNFWLQIHGCDSAEATFAQSYAADNTGTTLSGVRAGEYWVDAIDGTTGKIEIQKSTNFPTGGASE